MVRYNETSLNFDRNLDQITGPINVVRLEGQIDSTKKVIYLFLDWHEDVNKQTECTNVYSRDVQKYLAQSFYELNGADKIYDFFMEIRPTDIMMNDINENREKYILQVMKLFSNVFNFNPIKNKVEMSNIFENVRLHYLDVRDYLDYHIVDPMESATLHSLEFMRNDNIDVNKLFHVIRILEDTNNNLDKTIDIFRMKKTKTRSRNKTKRNDPLIRDYEGMNENIIRQITNKMRFQYKHNNIKIKLNNIFDEVINNLESASEQLKNLITLCIDYREKIIQTQNKLQEDEQLPNNFTFGLNHRVIRRMIVDICNGCQDLYVIFVKLLAYVTDIYFMRRFLDKDYITNAVVFSGANHSINYIDILVSSFDFKITHVANLKTNNIKELNQEIRRRLKRKIATADLFYPDMIIQCSDVTDFPPNFS